MHHHLQQGVVLSGNPIPAEKTAVVTGAGGTAGIGRTVAGALSEAGWHVALVDINADGLAKVEKELKDSASSITAFDGGGTFSKGVYATAKAKAAVIGMCHGGARELGPFGITVNVLAPGPIDTEIMGGKLTDERKASMSSTIPLGRVGQPAEIAATVAFLFSGGRGTSRARPSRSTAASTCTESRSSPFQKQPVSGMRPGFGWVLVGGRGWCGQGRGPRARVVAAVVAQIARAVMARARWRTRAW